VGLRLPPWAEWALENRKPQRLPFQEGFPESLKERELAAFAKRMAVWEGHCKRFTDVWGELKPDKWRVDSLGYTAATEGPILFGRADYLRIIVVECVYLEACETARGGTPKREADALQRLVEIEEEIAKGAAALVALFHKREVLGDAHGHAMDEPAERTPFDLWTAIELLVVQAPNHHWGTRAKPLIAQLTELSRKPDWTHLLGIVAAAKPVRYQLTGEPAVAVGSIGRNSQDATRRAVRLMGRLAEFTVEFSMPPDALLHALPANDFRELVGIAIFPYEVDEDALTRAKTRFPARKK